MRELGTRFAQQLNRIGHEAKSGFGVHRVHVEELVERVLELDHDLACILDAPDGVVEDGNKPHLAAPGRRSRCRV